MLLSFYWPCDLLHCFASLPLQSTPERKRRNFWYLCILGFLLIINCKELNLKCLITCNASAHLVCLWSQMLSPNRSMPQPKARKWIHACKNIFLKNTFSIWFFWSIFRWLRNSRLPNSIIIWLSNHLKSPLVIKFIPVLIQPNKKNCSASEFVRNFKTIQTHFSKNSMFRAWSRGSILISSLFWMIWVWPEIKVRGFVCLVSHLQREGYDH